MLFSSITFLHFFLPAVLLVYFVVPKALKNYVLLAFSLVFYFFGEPVYTVLLLLSSLSGYLHSLFIEAHRDEPKKMRAALISSVIISVGLLGFFKYADFFIGIVNGIFGVSIAALNIPLPIGISFFTFQTMSYTIDVYRGEARAERNFASLATYVCLFPQLIAGPIVRYSDVAAEMHSRSTTADDFYIGIKRFCVGLGKKVLIANACGELCAVFRSSNEKSVVFYWLYAIGYMLQIYFDFSGYSDMAIGLGRMFGFKFPENFDFPYMSRSITEFWRRWHMTLGSWFRDYVYIPLGGNRVKTWRWMFNIFAVWFLTGLWHGASWNFAIWGLYFGILLAAEKKIWGKALAKAPAALQHFYTLFIVLISFVIFNASSLSGAVADISGMFGAGGIEFCNAETIYYLKSYAVLIAAAVIGSTPLVKNIALRAKNSKVFAGVSAVGEPLFTVATLLLSNAYIVDGSFNPFLYFRF